jgi:hypothetical protein
VTIALALIFVGVIVFRHLQGRIAENASRTTLARESSVLTREFLRFEFSRGRDLIPFVPPSDPAQRPMWAKRIEENLLQPAAICIVNGSAPIWVSKPRVFGRTADSVQWLLISPRDMRRRASIDVYGEMEVQRASFQPDSTDNHSFWLVGKVGDSLRWGIVISSNDTWLSFFKRLEGSYAEEAEVGSPAWALQDMFALPRSPTRRWNMGLRAFLDDSLIFASGGLDTTGLQYTYDFNGRKAECYQSSMQKSHARWMAMRYVFWPMLLFPIVLFFPFYRFYRQIRSLTEPDKP